MFNLYLEAVKKAHKKAREEGSNPFYFKYPDGKDELYIPFSEREELVGRYSWAIPNEEAIETLVRHSPLVEIGAGTGYWAWLVKKAGGDIIAFDKGIARPKSYMAPKHLYTPVLAGDEKQAGKFPDRSLFLCWPPYVTPMAYRAAKAYCEAGGQTILYVGEGRGGCTGTDAFFDFLYEHYTEAESVDIPQHYGIRDAMYIYARRYSSMKRQTLKSGIQGGV